MSWMKAKCQSSNQVLKNYHFASFKIHCTECQCRAWILTGVWDAFLIFGNLLVKWRQPADITPNKRTSHYPLSPVSDSKEHQDDLSASVTATQTHRLLEVCLHSFEFKKTQLIKPLAVERSKSHPDRHCSLSRGVPTFSSAGRKEIVPS